MGRLLEGTWITSDLGADAQGRYVRRATQFQHRFGDDDGRFPAAAAAAQERYLLVVGSPCGWSHRVLLVRALLGLEQVIPVIFTDAFMGEEGWTFYQHGAAPMDTSARDNNRRPTGGILAEELYLDPRGAGYEPQQVLVQKMHELYVLGQSAYTGRASVPLLWDKQTGSIVNNESSIMIDMFAKDLHPLATHKINLLPDELVESIEAVKTANYMPINNGVYRCGFAGSQQAYTEAAVALFARLDELEALLGRQRYLCSNTQVTMADLCLFPTLYRFDTIYYTHFKCNQKHLYEYPHLWAWTREIYQMPGVADTCKMKECCIHYYTSHESVHPRRYIPLGPDLDFEAPHGRG